MTLTDWLLARLDEDEQAARAASEPGNYTHYADTAAEECIAMAEGEGCSELGIEYFRRVLPVRMLAEVEATRRIVELHICYPTPQELIHGTILVCSECRDVDDRPIEWPCETLRLLALPYADQPDYREEWRPSDLASVQHGPTADYGDDPADIDGAVELARELDGPEDEF